MTDFRPGGFQQLPIIVKNLLIINVLVFLLATVLESRGVNLDNYLALYYWQSPHFRWWQLFTHMFMHANLMHIAFNMFSLWMFGRILENFWGPQRFLLFYIICGVGAAICYTLVLTFQYQSFYNDFLAYQQHPGYSEFVHFIHSHHVPVNEAALKNWALTPDAPADIRASFNFLNQYYFGDAQMPGIINDPMVGASGAVCALLFAFGYLFPNTELYIYFIPIPIKAKWVVTGFILLELSEGVYHSAGDNIAHFAHLGGMLFAFILLRIWNKKIRNRFY